ncbi:MAG: hypothetical protein ACKO4T_05880 [Planctomycetaceae bacterium]
MTPRLPTNPFATRFTRPGVLPPLDRHGNPIDTARLVRSLQPGAVVVLEGPHGHGKSNLLAALLAAAQAGGRETLLVRMRTGLDAWKAVAAALTAPRRACLGCDGWERCPPGTTAIIRGIAAVRRLSVIVTAHGPLGLPVLARCGTSARLLAALVARLPGHGDLIDGHDIDDAFTKHAGNLREALYDLYDRFERRIRERCLAAQTTAG